MKCEILISKGNPQYMTLKNTKYIDQQAPVTMGLFGVVANFVQVRNLLIYCVQRIIMSFRGKFPNIRL